MLLSTPSQFRTGPEEVTEQFHGNEALLLSSKSARLPTVTNMGNFSSKQAASSSGSPSSNVFLVSNYSCESQPVRSVTGKNSPAKSLKHDNSLSGTTRYKDNAAFISNETDTKHGKSESGPSASSNYIGPVPYSFYTGNDFTDLDAMRKGRAVKRSRDSFPPCFALGLFAVIAGLLTLIGGVVMTVTGYSNETQITLRVIGIVFIILGAPIVFVGFLYFSIVVPRHSKALKRHERKNIERDHQGVSGERKRSQEEINIINRMFRVKTYIRDDIWSKS